MWWMAMGALAQDGGMAEAVLPTEENPAEVDEATTKLTAELGATFASGNAVFYSVNGGIDFRQRWKRNGLSVPALVNLGRAVPDADGNGSIDEEERDNGLVENARRVLVEPRYDRFLSDRDSLFVVAGVLHDPFLGYDLRPHETIGYSRLLVDEAKTQLRVEGGFDWAQEFYVEGTDPRYQNIFALRVLGALDHAFSESVGLQDTVEIYENVVDLADFRLVNTLAFTSALNDTLTLKLSHKLFFDNVPVPGFRKTDQTTGITLVATLL